MKQILTALALCLIAAAAHAGEPWPANVCERLAKYELTDVKASQGDAETLARTRSNVLHMMRAHCGVDTSAKIAADNAAVSAPSYGSGGEDGGGGGGGWQPLFQESKPPSMHCTTMALGGGLSATDCE